MLKMGKQAKYLKIWAKMCKILKYFEKGQEITLVANTLQIEGQVGRSEIWSVVGWQVGRLVWQVGWQVD